MFRKLFSGQYSVAATYWGGFAGFNLLMQVLDVALTPTSLWLYINFDENLTDLAVAVLPMIGVIYCAFLARGMYRAMHDDRRPGGWGWIGFSLIIVGVVSYGHNVAVIFTSLLPASERAIRTEISSLKLSLPYEMEPGVILSDVSLRAGVYRYDFKVTGDWYDVEIDMLTETEHDDTCEDLRGFFRGAVDRLELVYHSPTATTVMYMDGKACLDSLARK